MKRTKQDIVDDCVDQLSIQARRFGKIGLADPYAIRTRLQLFTKKELEAHLAAKSGSSGRLCEVSG